MRGFSHHNYQSIGLNRRGGSISCPAALAFTFAWSNPSRHGVIFRAGFHARFRPSICGTGLLPFMKTEYDDNLFKALDHIPAIAKERAALTRIRQQLTGSVDLLDTDFDSHLRIITAISEADELIGQAQSMLHLAGVKLAEVQLAALHPETLPAMATPEDEAGAA